MEFLVQDWTNATMTNKAEIKIVDYKELLDLLDKAKKEDLKIAVFEIGECLLDWS